MLIFSTGALIVPFRKLVSCAPHSTTRTCSFHSVWLLRTSFLETDIKEMVVEAKLQAVIVELLDVIYVERLTLIIMLNYYAPINSPKCLS
jgi:hypothetical protein